MISVLIEIAVAYLSHNCSDFLRVPYLNVEGFVQLDPANAEISRPSCFLPKYGLNAVFNPHLFRRPSVSLDVPHASEKTIFLDIVIDAWQPGGSNRGNPNGTVAQPNVLERL
jgi:hypothetical protein